MEEPKQAPAENSQSTDAPPVVNDVAPAPPQSPADSAGWKPKTELPKVQKPAKPKATASNSTGSYTAAIVATVVIVIGLAAIALVAFIKQK